jgi:hypothetical protein
MLIIQSKKNGQYIDINLVIDRNNNFSLGLFTVQEAEEFCQNLSFDLQNLKEKVKQIKKDYSLC